jgi:hypothetical protein
VTVLLERASEEFTRSLAKRIMQEVRLDPEKEDTEYAQEHRAAAGELGDYLLTLPADDPRFWALSQLRYDPGGDPDLDSYEPGRKARAFVSGLGFVGPAPEPSDALNELVAAAVVDYVAEQAAAWEKAVDLVEGLRV